MGAAAASWSPLSLPGLIGWWDASDLSTITASSGAVSEWRDKSGNGIHWEVNGVHSPTTGARTQNGLNGLDFYHGGQFDPYASMTSTGMHVGGFTARFVWCVWKSDTISTGGDTMLEPGVPGTPTSHAWAYRTSNADHNQDIVNSLIAHNEPGGQTATTDGVTYTRAMQYVNTPTLDAYLNGAHDGTQMTSVNDSFTDPSTSYLLGAGDDNPAFFALDGGLFELIVADAVIAGTGNATSLETYGNAKWAIY